MIRKGDKVLIVKDNAFAIVCECMGVNRNGNSVVKLDIYRRTGDELNIPSASTLEYIVSRKYTAYTFEEAINEWAYGETFNRRSC